MGTPCQKACWMTPPLAMSEPGEYSRVGEKKQDCTVGQQVGQERFFDILPTRGMRLAMTRGTTMKRNIMRSSLSRNRLMAQTIATSPPMDQAR